LLRNAQKRDKKIEPNNRGMGEKKRDENKTTFFVMSPDELFRIFVFRVFELLLLRNAQKAR
jgi:hypothetical protein